MKGIAKGPRILVITTIPQTMAAFLVPQLRSLAGDGFEVHAVSSPGVALDTLAIGNNVTTHGVRMERQPHPVKDFVSLWRLFLLMRRLRPQIVHAHTPKAGLVGMLAARLAGVPVRLYTVHGLPLLTRNGMWQRILKEAERLCGLLATQNYAVSESVRALLVEFGLCESHRVKVLGDGSCAGVDVNRFGATSASGVRAAVRREWDLPDEAIVVTFVGRFARDKGIAVLAEAWPAPAELLPNLYLVMVGEEDHSDPVPAAALAGLREHNRVRFPGTAAQEKMPCVYAASDIVVLPTFREGLPQTALEAAASGLPMVSTLVSGVVDIVEDGVTGILVSARDARALGAAIRALALDPQRRFTMGQAARFRVCERFSEQRMNALWLAEYRRFAEKYLAGTATVTNTGAIQARGSDAY